MTDNREILNHVYDAMPCGVAIFDEVLPMRILYANKTLCQMLGCGREEITTVRGIVDPDYFCETIKDVARIDSSPEEDGRVRFERKLLSKSGKPVYISGSLSRFVPVGQSEPCQRRLVLTTFNDVTREREQTAEKEKNAERYRILTEHVGVTLIDFDLKTGEVAYSGNTEAYDLPRPSPAHHLIPIFSSRCVHPDDQLLFETFYHEFRRADKKEVTLRIRRKNGEYRYTKLVFTRLRDDERRPVRDIVTMMDVDDEVRLKNKNAASEMQFDNILSLIPDGVVCTQLKPEYKMTFVSDRAREILECTDEEIQTMFENPGSDLSTIGKIHKSDYCENADEEFDLGHIVEGQTKLVDSNGKTHWIHAQSKRFKNDLGELFSYTSLMDVTELYEQREAVRRQEERYRLLSENCEATTYDYSVSDDRMVYTRFVGGERMENTCEEFLRTQTESLARALNDPFGRIISDQSEQKLISEVPLTTESGERWFKNTSVGLRDESGEITRIIGRLDDIHRMKLEQMRLRNQALIDPLTDILNRNGFLKRTRKMLKGISLENDFSGVCAFILLDIDKFKEVNDSFGHIFGDKVLRLMGHCLKAFTRQQPYEMECGRFGGDEFTIFIREIESREKLEKLLDELLKTLSQEIDGRHVTVSAGCAIYPDEGIGINELYRAADRALYRVKAFGGDGYSFSDENKEYLETLPACLNTTRHKKSGDESRNN